MTKSNILVSKICKIYKKYFILSSIILFSRIFNGDFHIDYFSEHLLNKKN